MTTRVDVWIVLRPFVAKAECLCLILSDIILGFGSISDRPWSSFDEKKIFIFYFTKTPPCSETRLAGDIVPASHKPDLFPPTMPSLKDSLNKYSYMRIRPNEFTVARQRVTERVEKTIKRTKESIVSKKYPICLLNKGGQTFQTCIIRE